MADFKKDFANHINVIGTNPYLFIGSGLSRRYLNMPTWLNLLKDFSEKLLLQKGFGYYDSKSEGNLPELASLMASEFHETWWTNPAFSDSRKEYENKIDIKDSKTNVTLEVNNDQWTNKQQNEITFDVYTNANTINDNMLKNPKIKIELPSQVEKVILGNSSVVYANGLELQDPYLETNKNGNIVIVANLIGEQTSYNDNSLGLITDVKISATVILKKDIEGAIENVNLIYANQYTLDGSTQVEEKNKQIKIENYKEEVSNQSEQIVASNVGDTLNTTSENVDGLKVEVVPVRGDTTLKDGDTVYEGEFIKYNIKVTYF